MLRRSLFVALVLVPAVFGQSQFAGKWQTRKSSITVNIVDRQGKLTGTVVFLGPLSYRLEMAISNPEERGPALEFETKDQDATFYWRLTLVDKKKGLLHGSMREMLIDERVKKRS
jgi:hypothetical protein